MVEKWELLEEWMWCGFDGCDEYDWMPSREFDPPYEIWTFDHTAQEIIHAGKRYGIERFGDKCLLCDLDETFMGDPAYCLILRKK